MASVHSNSNNNDDDEIANNTEDENGHNHRSNEPALSSSTQSPPQPPLTDTSKRRKSFLQDHSEKADEVTRRTSMELNATIAKDFALLHDVEEATKVMELEMKGLESEVEEMLEASEREFDRVEMEMSNASVRFRYVEEEQIEEGYEDDEVDGDEDEFATTATTEVDDNPKEIASSRSATREQRKARKKQSTNDANDDDDLPELSSLSVKWIHKRASDSGIILWMSRTCDSFLVSRHIQVLKKNCDSLECSLEETGMAHGMSETTEQLQQWAPRCEIQICEIYVYIYKKYIADLKSIWHWQT